MDSGTTPLAAPRPPRPAPSFLLAACLAPLFLAPSAFGQDEARRAELLDVQARRNEIAGEASPELFAINLKDNGVSLFLSGFWKGSLFGTWGLAKSPLGWKVAATESPLLFTQEADLTLSLWINERWFVEASFQEDYDVNTYRAGYQGKEGEFIRYMGVGNTGLNFPVFPYLDLGGDSASSMGFYGAFGSGPLSLHTLVRYDAAEREERVFVGGRERSYTELSVSGILRGVSFVLPAEEIASTPVVYLEDRDGPYTDERGTRWRLARPSEAAVSARSGLVELSGAPSGMAAAAYPGDYDAQMGAYTTGGTFLGAVQDYFFGIDLTRYPQCGQRGSAAKPGIVTINGSRALIIYEKGAFSPFERQSRYTAPASNAASAALVDSSTKEVIRGWDVYKLEDSAASLALYPLYVNEESNTTFYARDIYELSRSGESDVRSSRARWPLGRDTAGNAWLLALYLGGGDGANDAALRWTNYGAQTGYTLGRDVLPGSVQVYRGGLTDPYWRFDEASGIVRLDTPAQQNEVIRISYLRRSLDRRSGSIAAGLGAIYEGEGALSARGALALRWNASNDAYSEAGVTSPGLAGFGGSVSWRGERLRADVSAGAGYEQPDTTGLYRAAGMEGHETIFELPDDSYLSYLPASGLSPLAALSLAERAPLVYRDYRETNAAGLSTLMPIEWDAPRKSGREGPYPARDNTFSAKVMAAEWELDGFSTVWTGFQSPLPDGAPLSSAEEIIVPLRYYAAQGIENLQVFVQFGPLSPKDNQIAENPALIVEREVTDAIRTTNTAFITLTAEERRKLRSATSMRVVVKASLGAARGRVLVAPPVIRGAAFEALALAAGVVALNLDPYPVSTVEVPPDSRLEAKYPDEIRRLHNAGEKQRVLQVSWSNVTAQPWQAAGAGGRLGKLPLENYKKLGFFIKLSELQRPDAALEVVVARGKSSLGRSGETALRARIPAAALLERGAASWVKVEARYGGGETGIFVGNERVAEASLDYTPAALRRRNAEAGEEAGGEDDVYCMVFLSPVDPAASGSFYLDELTLEDGNPSWYLNAGARLKWTRPGALLRAGTLAVFENASFETALETTLRGNPASQSARAFSGAINRSRGEISLFGTRLSGELSFSLTQDGYGSISWWKAGHGISRTDGPLTVHERFFLDGSGGIWNHGAGLAVEGVYHALFSAEGREESGTVVRSWRGGGGARSIAGAPLRVTVNADWRWTERGSLESLADAAYGAVWLESLKTLSPDNGAGAEARQINGSFETALSTKPVGAGLLLAMTQNASSVAKTTTSGGRAELAFPWQAGRLNGSFRMERRYERTLGAAHESVEGDLEEFADAFTHAGAPLAVPPFFALFDAELPAKTQAALADARNAAWVSGGAWGDRYRAALQLPSRRGLSALFVPRDVSAHIDRNILVKFDTTQDILGVGGSVGTAAQNLFGAFGVRPVFSFYQTDEFRQELSAAVALPKNDTASWRVNLAQSAGFFGFEGAELRLSDTMTLLSTGFLLGAAVEWISPVEKSLTSAFYDWVMRRFRGSERSPALASLAGAQYERVRKEKLQVDVDRSAEYARYALSAGHESIVRIAGRLELIVFITLSCAQDKQTETLSFIAVTGTSLRISF